MTEIVIGLCFAKNTSQHGHTMHKHYPVNETPASHESAEPGDGQLDGGLKLPAAPVFWILKNAAAKKLGKR